MGIKVSKTFSKRMARVSGHIGCTGLTSVEAAVLLLKKIIRQTDTDYHVELYNSKGIILEVFLGDMIPKPPDTSEDEDDLGDFLEDIDEDDLATLNAATLYMNCSLHDAVLAVISTQIKALEEHYYLSVKN